MTVLGVLTIGQSPRTDLIPEIASLLDGITLQERGVLDGLSRGEVAALAPLRGEDVLTTRLSDGSSVLIGEDQVVARMPGVIAELEARVDAVLLACTGPFHDLAHTKPLFLPDRIITYTTAALSGDGDAVGVICPLPEQAGFTVDKFRPRLAPGTPILIGAASPYTAGPDEIATAGSRLASRGARILALDCIGYTEAMRAAVAAATGLPVVLARSSAARLAAEAMAPASVGAAG